MIGITLGVGNYKDAGIHTHTHSYTYFTIYTQISIENLHLLRATHTHARTHNNNSNNNENTIIAHTHSQTWRTIEITTIITYVRVKNDVSSNDNSNGNNRQKNIYENTWKKVELSTTDCPVNNILHTGTLKKYVETHTCTHTHTHLLHTCIRLELRSYFDQISMLKIAHSIRPYI